MITIPESYLIAGGMLCFLAGAATLYGLCWHFLKPSPKDRARAKYEAERIRRGKEAAQRFEEQQATLRRARE